LVALAKRQTVAKIRVIEQRPPAPKATPLPLHLAIARDSITR
jgi:hypothetical protein